jgi:Zn-dependent peptidase ImmA (M78 family)
MVSSTFAANRLLDDLTVESLNDLACLELIAFARDAVVQYQSLQGAEARLTVWGARSVITISNSVTNAQRRRFSIGHELGHLEMHRYQKKVFFCTTDDIDDWHREQVDPNLEEQANEFAAALLLPERFFVPLSEDTDPSWNVIEQLARTFNTSLTATALRYVRLSKTPTAVVFVRDGRVVWFRRSEVFQELGAFVDVRARISPGTMTGKYLSNGRVRVEPQRLNSSEWLVDWRLGHDVPIFEQYRPIPPINAVLSLLWFDYDDIADI